MSAPGPGSTCPGCKTTSSQVGRGEQIRLSEGQTRTSILTLQAVGHHQAAFERPPHFIFSVLFISLFVLQILITPPLRGACQRSTVGIRQEQLRTA